MANEGWHKLKSPLLLSCPGCAAYILLVAWGPCGGSAVRCYPFARPCCFAAQEAMMNQPDSWREPSDALLMKIGYICASSDSWIERPALRF